MVVDASSLYPTHTIICKVPQLSTEFQTQIQRRTPIGRWVKTKADIKYPIEHGKVINYTLDDLSMHPVTTKIQASNGDFQTVTEFNGCDWRKLRMDQQHCSYFTKLT
jgi:hypothetical protein